MINLFKAQNDLNALVSNAHTPEQMDATKVYLKHLANGANPEIPQYVALNFLNQMESAQPPVNTPTGTLKDKLIGTPQPPMQAQGMPQGAPQQPTQQQPVQAPQQHPQMAGGGVAHLPVPETMYNFKGGGIIGFKTGDPVPDISSSGLMAQAAQGAANFTGAEPVDPDVVKAQYIAAHPDQAGILARPVAEAMSRGLTEQEARDKVEYEKQTGAESQRRKEIALSNALLQAAEQTRGTKGIGGLGPALAGLGGSFNAANTAELDRLAALSKGKREQDMLMLKYKNEVEAAQRAAAENDYGKHLSYLNAAAQTKAEAAKLGIDVAAKLAGVAGQLEGDRLKASAAHVNPILQLEEALRTHPERVPTLEKAIALQNYGRTDATERARLADANKEYITERPYQPMMIAAEKDKAKQQAMIAANNKALRDVYTRNGLNVPKSEEEADQTAAPGSLPPVNYSAYQVHR